MMNEALLFLLDVLLQPFAAILLLRFHLQWLRATLLLALLVEAIYLTGFLWVQGYPFHGFPLPGLLLLALVKLFKIGLYLLMAFVFAQAILSWINPHSPIAPL